MALVYYYFDPKGQSEDSHRATLIATTLVVVMFSITVFGAVTKPLLDFTLGMGQGGRGSPPPAASTPHNARGVRRHSRSAPAHVQHLLSMQWLLRYVWSSVLRSQSSYSLVKQQAHDQHKKYVQMQCMPCRRDHGGPRESVPPGGAHPAPRAHQPGRPQPRGHPQARR